MGNCLVIKLREGINNDNLPKLGEFAVDFNNANNCLFGGIYDDLTSFVTRANGNLTITDVGSDYRKSYSGTGRLFISNKYKISSLQVLSSGVNFPISSLETLSALKQILIRVPITGFTSTDQLSNLNIKDLDIENINISGTVLDLPKTLKAIDIKGNNVTGNIKSFGLFKNLTNLNSLSSTLITGSLESLVAVARGHERPSGSISFTNPQYFGSDITFKGSHVTGLGESIMLTWDATTITFNGETINNSDVEN